MKKKIVISLGAFALLAAAGVGFTSFQKADSELLSLLVRNIEALAGEEINPDCPNGCLDNGDGCYCRQNYPSYREAD